MKGAEPFLLQGGKRGVLLTHGFTGAPSEMRLLGQFLHAKGFTVLAPRLLGHGSTVEDMARTEWPDWYAAVEDGYHLLSGLCNEIYPVGLSMGGLLSLKLASEYKVEKIAVLSTPIHIADKRLPLLPVYSKFRGYIPKKRKRMDVDPIYSVCYNAIPLKSLNSLLQLIKTMEQVLPKVDVPALVMQSKAEHTVIPDSAQYIYDRLLNTDKELVWLEHSGHILTLDMEREKVFNMVAEWIG
jgi:carboxylesterase